MARGNKQSEGRSARSEFPMGASDRGFASEGGSAGMPSAERIQAFYNPARTEFTIGLKAKGNEHRQFARSILQDAFASSEYAELGLPDSQYAMDALDAMQRMAERWAASGKAPTMAQTTEFREIAKRAVKSMTDELNQEARALRAEYNREEGGGRTARSEAGGGTPTQPDGSATKYPKMRESLRLLGAGMPTISGKTNTKDFAFNTLNKYFSGRSMGLDLNDLPDSNKVWGTVAKMAKKLDGFIKNPASATDEAMSKYHKSAIRAAERIKNLAMRDEL